MDLMAVRRLLDSGASIFDIPLRAVFYARVSTDRDAQLNSLVNQVTYYEDFIKKIAKWSYQGAYIDEGISGTSALKREDFLRMIGDAHSGRFDIIITKEISRFSRNTLDSIKYTQELLECGVGVYFQNDNINTLYTDAELRLTIMASIAQDEVRRLSERVKFGMKRAYESGRVLGQDNLYGYDKRQGRLFINDKEAEFIRTLFALYSHGQYGFRAIAKELTEMGYRNQSGGEINPGTLRGILQNPKYKGYYNGRKTESADYRRQVNVRLPAEQQLYYRDENIPPIISEELFDKVQRMLAQRREKYKKKEAGTQSRYPYSGRIICERCGCFHYRVVHRDRKKNREVWVCKTRTQRGKAHCATPYLGTEELDAILGKIGEDLLPYREEIVSSLMARYLALDEAGDNLTDALAKLEREAEKLLQKKERLLEYSLDGAVTRQEFRTMNERLEKSLSKAREKMAELRRGAAMSDDSAARVALIERHLGEQAQDSALPLEAARNLVSRILVREGSTRESTSLIVGIRYAPSVNARIERLGILYRQTEVSPIIGTEKQSEELVRYLLAEFESDPSSIWGTNMFGKSLEEMVKEGLSNKLMRMPEDVQMKIQETLQRIINDGSGGLICILL